MRCKNCGWENPDGNQKCERCSSFLEGTVASNVEICFPVQSTDSSSNLRSTIREATEDIHYNKASSPSLIKQQPIIGGNDIICSNCGYNLSPNMNVCPQCGTSQKHNGIGCERDRKDKVKYCPKCNGIVAAGARFCPTCGQRLSNNRTVNAWDNPQNGDFCSLRPIPWSKENTEYNAISFSGERVVLNRANTDPNNQSITSREQAVLTHDGKDWYIEDLSEQHSTMLRVSRKTKLQSGDIIALGNRLFEFKD